MSAASAGSRRTIYLGATGDSLAGLGSNNLSARIESLLRRGDWALRALLPEWSAAAWASVVHALWEVRYRVGDFDEEAVLVLREWGELNGDWPVRVYGPDACARALSDDLDRLGGGAVSAVVEMVERYEPLVGRIAQHGDRLMYLGLIDQRLASEWDAGSRARSLASREWQRHMQKDRALREARGKGRSRSVASA